MSSPTPTPITLADFNDSFKVRVADYKSDPNTSNITIYYEVKCLLNNRVSVHVANVDTTQLQEGYTFTDVIDAGWQAVKDTVSSWSSSNVIKPQLTTFTPSTTSDDISVIDFNNNFSVSVQRFELYPTVQPNSWCIGLAAYSKTKENIVCYRDCNVSLSEFCNDTRCLNIATAAWDQLQTTLCSWAATEFAKANVINTIYIPTDVTPTT
jgi:hypothetical protein